MTKTDQDREDFEAWWFSLPKPPCPADPGDFAWRGWQAALSHERARAASPAPQVPDGWKLVPYAVTPNMERAAATAFERGDPTWPALLDAAPPAPVASHEPASVSEKEEEVNSLEEAIRLAEVGEYLLNACLYIGGDGYAEPRELGIEWQWQKSAPDQYGQGMLLAAATKWHDEQAEDGIVTEARKLRAAISQDIMQVGSER